jgi:NADPH2:quinone reductase
MVLISGGAGAVGRAAIELARYLSAGHILTTVSGPEKAQLARATGAQTIVNYRDADASEQIKTACPEGIDHFVEVAIDQNLELDLKVAAPNASIVAYAGNDSSSARVPVRELMAANISLHFMLLYAIRSADLAAAISGVCEALSAGALTAPPLHRYSLEQVSQAHDAVEGGAVGKVVIDV